MDFRTEKLSNQHANQQFNNGLTLSAVQFINQKLKSRELRHQKLSYNPLTAGLLINPYFLIKSNVNRTVTLLFSLVLRVRIKIHEN